MSNSPEQKLIEAMNLIMRCDSLECAKSHSALANTYARHFLDELAELREALSELCRLKTMKDRLGKTPEYLADREKAWDKAFSLIEQKERT